MDDITHCPRCGSSDISVEPIMRGSSDETGALVYWRCGECKAIVSRLTAEQALGELPIISVAEGFARRSGHAERN